MHIHMNPYTDITDIFSLVYTDIHIMCKIRKKSMLPKKLSVFFEIDINIWMNQKQKEMNVSCINISKTTKKEKKGDW